MSATRFGRRTRVAYLKLHGIDPEYEAAGLRYLTRPRSARGTLVGVYDAVEAGIDEYGYATVCETHGRLVLHDTLTLARHHASDPAGWCGVCSGDEVDEEAEEIEAALARDLGDEEVPR